MNYTEDIYYKILKRVLSAYKIGGVTLVILSFAVLIANSSPTIVYSLDSGSVQSNKDVLLESTISTQILRKVDENDSNKSTSSNQSGSFTTARKLPAKNSALPKEPTLIIKSIGVNGPIHRGSDGESELDKGVWMPPGFKNPVDSNVEPIMLISHRFGYISWSNDFRRENSFYNLPKVNPGDEIIIIWDQRPFKYVVKERRDVSGTVSTSNDLVLYTCKFFRSKERIVLLADRTN